MFLLTFRLDDGHPNISVSSESKVMTGMEPDKPVVISPCEGVAGADVDAPGEQNHRDGFWEVVKKQVSNIQFRGHPALRHQEKQTCTCTCTADLMRVF